jgi:hypothetical protein
MKIDRNQSAETTSLGSEPNSSIYRDTAQRFSPTAVMPHSALPPQLRQALPSSGRGTAADPDALGARFYSDDRAIPGLKAADPVRSE